MELKWTARALSDLERLHEFLAPASSKAAADTVRALVAAPERLLEHPRIGERLPGFGTREVRRLLVGRYELRYELGAEAVYILRIWHTREDR
jgi:plasmid stabilization system protein ParE